jgi:hypothetical protein
MAVSYSSFLIKYVTFVDLLEPQFNALLPDALAEVNRYKWELLGIGYQVFKDKAVENLIACQLSRLSPEYLGSGGLAEFEVREAGYKLKYLSNSGGSKNNPFCDEYQRLLLEVQKLDPSVSALPACTVAIPKKISWV